MIVRRFAARALSAVRFGNWWAHKIPPLLFVVYVELVRRHASLGASVTAIAVLVGCVSCVAAYGHVLNDWCDIADDARAGKPNAMRDVAVWRRAVLCAALVAAGFLILAPFANASLARLTLAANYLWPTLYSLPPVRLKERGLLGVLSDAAGSHVTPTLFACADASLLVPGAANPVIVAAVALWAAVLGIKGIVYHMIADRANDEAAGVATFASRLDLRRVAPMLARCNLWLELPVSVLLTMAVAAFVPLAVAAFVVYVGLEWAKFVLRFEFAVSSDARLRRRSVPFANEMFSTLWLPLAAVFQLAFAGIAFAWLPVLHVLLFRRQVAVQIGDARALAGQLRMRLAVLGNRGS